MSLPPPTSSFTIPSLHDDLELDCRIYYPHRSDSVNQTLAILAHPYAPLGGSYDDGVIALVGSALLRKGILLGTFNFRGAPGSPGRTSWSGRAELGDYVAFYAVMLRFAQATTTMLVSSDGTRAGAESPLLIVGGYSYGSLIASCVPPQNDMIKLLGNPDNGSTESEIGLRAQQLAKDYVAYLKLQRQESSKRGRVSLHATSSEGTPGSQAIVGGYDSEAASRRISRDSSIRSLDGQRVRQSLDRARHRLTRRTNSDRELLATPSSKLPVSSQKPPDVRVAYLLVSPILPPVSGFITFFSKPSFERQKSSNGGLYKDRSDKEEKLLKHQSCVIYGDKDSFTSSKKVKKWVDGLQQRANALSSYGIEGAGHFWTEPGAADRLTESVTIWLNRLLPDNGTGHTVRTIPD